MMEVPVDLPAWAALLTSVLILLGAGLTLIGTIGLVRLNSFYARVHPPTLGSTLGVGSILLASMLFFTLLEGRPVVHEVLIAIFVTITTPISLVLLASAALQRDWGEGNPDVPQQPDLPNVQPKETET